MFEQTANTSEIRRLHPALIEAIGKPTKHAADASSTRKGIFMAYLRRMMIVPSLVISLALANPATAQQSSPSTEQAKKEGEVVWYGTLTGGAIVGNILKSFENKYPGIKVKYLRLGGASFVERIRSEARAGKFLWDIVTSEYIQYFELSKY